MAEFFQNAGRRWRSPLLLAVLGLLALSLAYVGHSYILIDDNLDTELAIPYALLHDGVALDYRPTAVVERLMNGVPRNALRPGLQPLMALMAMLDPLPAYLLHELLVRLAGLLGMYRLLRRYGLPDARHRALCAGLALAWAVLPTYTVYGASLLGQPWVVLALLNLRRGSGRWTDWLVLVLFPFWSSLVLAGAFVGLGAGLALGWDAWRRGRVAWRPVLGLVVLGAAYVVAEFPLLYSVLSRQMVPHRLEFDYARLTRPGLGVGLRGAAQYFLLGQYHSSLFVRVVPLVAAGLAWRWAAQEQRPMLLRRLGAGLGLLAGLAVFCGFYPQLIGAVQRHAPALGAFNLSRFHFLTPLLWFGLLVLSLRYVPRGRWRWALVVAQLTVGLGMNLEWTRNVQRLAGRLPASEPTYTAYVAPQLFARIQQDLAQRTRQEPAGYRVACLGLPPAVATLNGFYTLDAYINNYPLAYKHRFRPVIAGELAKSLALQAYFDAWGNRCYLFSAELGRNFRVGGEPVRTVQDLRFNAAAFEKLGGRYVLSAARLARPETSDLQLVADYAEPPAFWHVWVYEVGPRRARP